MKPQSTRIGFKETVNQIILVILVILAVACTFFYMNFKGANAQYTTMKNEISENEKIVAEAEAEAEELATENEELKKHLTDNTIIQVGYDRNYYDAAMNVHTFRVQKGAKKTDKQSMNYGASSYTDDLYKSQVGLDVSSHQGGIDWEQVAQAKATGNSGYKFAYIRALYRGYEAGDLSEDTTFAYNLHGAYDNGLDVGVYVYSQAITEEEAIEEAKTAIEIVEREGFTPKTLTYGIALDIELPSDDARTAELTKEEWTKNAEAFCKTIEEAGYKTRIYTGLEFEAEKLDMTTLDKYGFWYAEYKDFPTTPYYYDIWQFTETGAVEGINGNVDIDIEFLEREKN